MVCLMTRLDRTDRNKQCRAAFVQSAFPAPGRARKLFYFSYSLLTRLLYLNMILYIFVVVASKHVIKKWLELEGETRFKFSLHQDFLSFPLPFRKKEPRLYYTRFSYDQLINLLR